MQGRRTQPLASSDPDDRQWTIPKPEAHDVLAIPPGGQSWIRVQGGHTGASCHKDCPTHLVHRSSPPGILMKGASALRLPPLLGQPIPGAGTPKTDLDSGAGGRDVCSALSILFPTLYPDNGNVCGSLAFSVMDCCDSYPGGCSKWNGGDRS